MRKYQQKLILEMLDLCERKHSNIKSLPMNKPGEIIEILNQCKGYAEQIGTFIEKLQGEGTQTVALLEEYCDMLCQMGTERKIRVERLRCQLIRIYNSVREDLKPDRLEIVFFPYNASMSDSLETIYLAAKADPQCDAYWVPIPYFEKKEDGSAGNFYYDGAEYPDYLEVTDFSKYDMEARHPDIVFIMNPYDDINYVTTVLPNYYSRNLKIDTDLLVYVDYGIPIWLARDAESYVTDCNVQILPFLANCDLYITYSVESADLFRYGLLRSKETKGLYSKKTVFEKIVPLGSPKFDRVFNTCREYSPVPEQWRAVIGDKKVLLYNTSLGELLQNSESFLDELNQVIETADRQNEIVLWWRPHPLTMSTINSMRPQLAARYIELVERFKNSDRGIYDDTTDLHRAIAWSDGCLTTESSLMFLYLASGKPFSVISSKKKLKNPISDNGDTFARPLKRRIENMKAGKGANVGNWACCIWWDNFLEEDVLKNVHYENFIKRFIHYIVHTDAYPEAEEYRQLQLQIFRDFVANPDGTAGVKIYEYCKERQFAAESRGNNEQGK